MKANWAHRTYCIAYVWGGGYCFLDDYYVWYNNSTTVSQTGAPFVAYEGDFSFHAAATSQYSTFLADLTFPLSVSESDTGPNTWCYGGPPLWQFCFHHGYNFAQKTGSGSAAP
jgi:hypothetical protein